MFAAVLHQPVGKRDQRNRVGETLIVAGPTLPPAVHALVHAMNAALGNVGKTVSYLPMTGLGSATSYDVVGKPKPPFGGSALK